jgi:predicted dehydrogenase
MVCDEMITIAVIGFGYWGPNMVRNLVQLPHTTASWVCDLNSKVLASIPQMYPTIKTTKNVDDVLTDADTDAVVIVTPPSTHAKLATAALMAGKHVLVEKPMTQTTSESRALVALAKAKKKTLMVDHTFLYTAAVRKLKHIIDSGTLGKVIYVDSVRTNLGLFQKDSNVLSDLAVHDFSIMDYLFGQSPVSITATGMNHATIKQETVAYVSAHYPSVFFHGHVSWLSPIKIRRMILVGTKKMAVYDDIEPSEKLRIYDKSVSVTHDLRVGYRSGNVVIPKLGVQEALTGVVTEFVGCIRRGKTPLTDGNQGQLVVRCIEAATKSLRSNGKSVQMQ